MQFSVWDQTGPRISEDRTGPVPFGSVLGPRSLWFSVFGPVRGWTGGPKIRLIFFILHRVAVTRSCLVAQADRAKFLPITQINRRAMTQHVPTFSVSQFSRLSPTASPLSPSLPSPTTVTTVTGQNCSPSPTSLSHHSLTHGNNQQGIETKRFLFNLLLVVSEIVISEFVVWLQSWGE